MTTNKRSRTNEEMTPRTKIEAGGKNPTNPNTNRNTKNGNEGGNLSNNNTVYTGEKGQIFPVH